MTFHKEHIQAVIVFGFLGFTFSIAAVFFFLQTYLQFRRTQRIPGKVLSYEELKDAAPAAGAGPSYAAIIEYAGPNGAPRRTKAAVGGAKPYPEGARITLQRDPAAPLAVRIAPSLWSYWWLPLMLAALAALLVAAALGAAFYEG